MDTQATIAYEAGKPLEVETVQLDGFKEGKVLVEIKAENTAIRSNAK